MWANYDDWKNRDYKKLNKAISDLENLAKEYELDIDLPTQLKDKLIALDVEISALYIERNRLQKKRGRDDNALEMQPNEQLVQQLEKQYNSLLAKTYRCISERLQSQNQQQSQLVGLPTEILQNHIFSFLSSTELGRLKLVSRDIKMHATTILHQEKCLYVGKYIEKEGGVVVHVDVTKRRALIVAIEDCSHQYPWGPIEATHIQRTELYTGQDNTIQLLSLPSQYAAARAARNYRAKGAAQGLNDWYLPSIKELELLYKNCNLINSIVKSNYGTELKLSYWSSSECPTDSIHCAFYIDCNKQGISLLRKKSSVAFVRPVRIVESSTGDYILR